MRFAALIVLCLMCFPCVAQEPAAKAAIPDETAQKAALAVIADVYKPDYEKATTPAQKVELAKKLLEEGTATKDDSVARFVLFRISREIAAQQGDLAVSFDAIGRIGSEFEADILQLKVDVATVASKALKTPKERQACATILMPLIDEAISVDRYDLARSLVTLALSSARGSPNSDLIEKAFSKLKEVEEVSAEFERVKESKITLEAEPTDPDANFEVGEFLCLVKGDWKRGLTMLALGSNEELKAAALLELEAKPDSLKLGDAWWKIAENLEGIGKRRMQAHASDWYRKALPGLSGLTKARVERVITQVIGKEAIIAPTHAAGSSNKQVPISGTWAWGMNKVVIENDRATETDPSRKVVATGTLVRSGKSNVRIVYDNGFICDAVFDEGGTVVATCYHKSTPNKTHSISGRRLEAK